MTGSAPRWWVPLMLSCAVYATPLVGPHAAWLLGEVLLRELTRPGDRDAAWRAADVALALGAQSVVALLIAWSLRGSRYRWLVWLPVVPALVAALNVAYLVAIPAYFLIEADRDPEVRLWQEVCSVPGASIAPVRMPATQPATATTTVWLQRSDGSHATLRLSDCTAVDAGIPRPTARPDGRVDFMLGLMFALPDGPALFERTDVDTGARSVWLWTGPATPLARLDVPGTRDGAPVLSAMADAVGWVEPVPSTTPPLPRRLVIQPRAASSVAERIVVDLAALMPASLTVLAIDMPSREALLWRNDAPAVIGFDGRVREVPFAPSPIQPQMSTYLRVGDGWVAWDAYRENGAYQLAWSLPAGAGRHRLNKGRSVTSAAVDPTGTFIALSETTTLNIGSAQDLVSVIRVRDRTTVFRAYLPRYARSTVLFLEGDLFAYADLRGAHLLKVER